MAVVREHESALRTNACYNCVPSLPSSLQIIRENSLRMCVVLTAGKLKEAFIWVKLMHDHISPICSPLQILCTGEWGDKRLIPCNRTKERKHLKLISLTPRLASKNSSAHGITCRGWVWAVACREAQSCGLGLFLDWRWLAYSGLLQDPWCPTPGE